MKQIRLVIALFENEAEEVLKKWHALIRVRGRIDLNARHIQHYGKCTIHRWDWLPMSEKDIYDFINQCERDQTAYHMLVIGKEDFSDIQEYKSGPMNSLPIVLEPHITVDVKDRENNT